MRIRKLQLRSYNYMARPKKRKEHWKIWLFVIMPIMLSIIGFVGHGYALADTKTLEASTFYIMAKDANSKVSTLKTENKKLITVAEVATASAKPIWLTEDQARAIISIVISDKPAQNRFYNIISKCENGPKRGTDGIYRFDPLRINWNSDGTYDLGFAQINSHWHASQVKSLLGEDFHSAMKDPVKNILFAAWLWQNDKNFHAWVCDGLVK